ncbi:hypothetical protein CCACVL1_01087, partial [Corchorus capsularis]
MKERKGKVKVAWEMNGNHCIGVK